MPACLPGVPNPHSWPTSSVLEALKGNYFVIYVYILVVHNLQFLGPMHQVFDVNIFRIALRTFDMRRQPQEKLGIVTHCAQSVAQ